MTDAPLRPDMSGFRRRLTELEGLLADPATFGDSRRAAALGAELRFTSKAVKADETLVGLEKELAESQALLTESEGEMRAMAEEEVRRLTPAVETAREQLIRAILPPNPDDSRNAMVEIRAGTGGDEASVAGTRWTRWTPASWRSRAVAPSPSISRTASRTPPRSDWARDISSHFQPLRSAKRV